MAKKILIVEDDKVSREVIRRILTTDTTYDVSTACDGEQAWSWLCEPSQIFDVAIVDIIMPRLGGFALIERIRSTLWLKNLPIILCTSAKDRTAIHRALSLSVKHYIVKPYTRAAVLSKINAALTDGALSAQPARVAGDRLGFDEETHQALQSSLADDIMNWFYLLHSPNSTVKYSELAIQVHGLQGACISLECLEIASILGKMHELFTANLRTPREEPLEGLDELSSALEENVRQLQESLPKPETGSDEDSDADSEEPAPSSQIQQEDEKTAAEA